MFSNKQVFVRGFVFPTAVGVALLLGGCGQGTTSTENSQSESTPSIEKPTVGETEILLGEAKSDETPFIENAFSTLPEEGKKTAKSVQQTTAITENKEPEKIFPKLEAPGKKIPKPIGEEIAKVLDEETEIEFIDVPLVDAIEFLSDLHNIDISIDEESLKSQKIDLDNSPPISHIIEGVSLRSALNIILEPLGLTFVPFKDGLQVTSGRITPGPAGNKVTAALAKEVNLQFTDTPLQSALQFLSDQQKITFILEEGELKKAGVKRDEPVSLTISKVTLDEALKKLLHPLLLTFRAEDEVIKIVAKAPER